jgi:hypothetical protein
MDESTIQLTPILVAVITAVSALIGGLIASVLGPIVKHLLDRKKATVEYQRRRLKDIRIELSELGDPRKIESTKSWIFISSNFNDHEKHMFNSGPGFPVTTELLDKFKFLTIQAMLYRLEQEWGLMPKVSFSIGDEFRKFEKIHELEGKLRAHRLGSSTLSKSEVGDIVAELDQLKSACKLCGKRALDGSPNYHPLDEPTAFRAGLKAKKRE